MKLRQSAADALLYMAAVLFAAWFGGQLFNAMMVVPVWSASPPESMVAYYALSNQYGRGSMPFFVLTSPLWTTLLLALSLALSWRGRPARRRRVLLFAACTAALTLVVLGWMAPTAGHVTRAAREGVFGAREADATRLWVVVNWARSCAELCVMFVALRAVGAAHDSTDATTRDASMAGEESARAKPAEAGLLARG